MTTLSNSQVKLNASGSVNELNQNDTVCVPIQNEIPDSSVALLKNTASVVTNSEECVSPMLQQKGNARLFKKVSLVGLIKILK